MGKDILDSITHHHLLYDYSRQRKGIRIMVKKIELSHHMGVEEYTERNATVFRLSDGYYEVEYNNGDNTINSLEFPSEEYADMSAENFCLGYSL